jgi:type I restriction enzyme, S subunit
MKIKKILIEDVCDFIGGSQPPKSTFSNIALLGYVRLIQIRDYKTDSFETFIPESSTSKFCDEKDIMIGRYGPPIFQICRGLKGAYNVALLKAKPKPIIDIDYLYYFLKQKSIFEYVDKLSSRTGGQTGVDLDSLNKYPIILPFDKHDQKKIAGVLSSIDAKIELNNKICSELESIAQDMYHYWFTQFDFANEYGRPYRSSGGEMVWNKDLKREIPKGWVVGTLLDIANYTNGLPCQRYRPIDENRLPVIKIKEMHAGFNRETEYVRSDIPNDLIVNDGDILFSWSASLEVQIWTDGKGALNQHIFKVTSSKYPKSFIYIQLLDYLNQFKRIAENRKTTMGHINQDHFEQSRIVIPPLPIIIQLDNVLAPVFQQIKIKKQESNKLASLRDFLLPLLMNGQVKVEPHEES